MTVGWLTGLVTLPLAPVRGTVWVAEQILAAERAVISGIDGAGEKFIGHRSWDREPGGYARGGQTIERSGRMHASA